MPNIAIFPKTCYAWGMAPAEKVKLGLEKRLKEVHDTPAGFGFFVSLHDFVEYIESAPSFAPFFSGKKKGSQASKLSLRYSVMKQVYQGIEDIGGHGAKDLGHDRYVAIHELTSIKNKDVSENNSFWKRRELLRKVAGETYETLQSYLSKPKRK